MADDTKKEEQEETTPKWVESLQNSITALSEKLTTKATETEVQEVQVPPPPKPQEEEKEVEELTPPQVEETPKKETPFQKLMNYLF